MCGSEVEGGWSPVFGWYGREEEEVVAGWMWAWLVRSWGWCKEVDVGSSKKASLRR
jgi:hypothetical protein